jgi:predicted O-methyltransferase YrrM
MTEFTFVDVSWRITKLAEAARSEGRSADSDKLIELAANLELLSADLQNCWGGPLNGQEGRREIFRQLIEKLNFDAIFETGTFRGITTGWFAEHFSGPIFSCEIERLYFLQAQSYLKGKNNVHLSLMDSREFLKRNISSSGESKRYFVYLDAHWKDDLPLAEEVKTITSSPHKCVIAIDDFLVPDDTYGYDDYGSGKVISLNLFEDLKDQGFRFFFPKLRASEESGAARGLCVLTNALAEELDQCDLLRGGTWAEWQAKDAAHRREVAASPPATPESAAGSSSELSQMTDAVAHAETNEASSSALDEGNLFSRLAELTQRQSELHALVEVCVRTLDDRLGSANERAELGRALVEEKARNLELQRVNHRLSDEIYALTHTSKSTDEFNGLVTSAVKGDNNQDLRQEFLRSQADIESLRGGNTELMQEFLQLQAAIDSLARSRVLALISPVAPRARRTVISINKSFSSLLGKLRAMDS